MLNERRRGPCQNLTISFSQVKADSKKRILTLLGKILQEIQF